jgi:hypothetical protein
MIAALQLPHWLILAGGALVLVGSMGIIVSHTLTRRRS